MRNVNEAATATAATVAPAATPAKAKRVRAAKPAAKPVVSEAKPAKADRQAESAAKIDAIRAARKLAGEAVATYYDGASLPFKAAADTFSPTDPKRTPKRATQRQAALLASMLLAGDNVKADGTFTRGGFILDGKAVQPESGCLSDMLNRVITYVSGPTSGAAQRDAIYRIDLKLAASEITAHIGGALAKAALARIGKLSA